MVIAIFIIFFCVMGWFVPDMYRAVTSRNKPVAITGPKLSWPAKQILKEYNKLPIENRPFSDITQMLLALDVKHGDEARSHFHKYDYYSWDCYCLDYYTGRECTLHEYKELLKIITGVAQAIEAQQHALEVAKVQHDLDDIKMLTERMREEKAIINSVTKELT